MGGRQVLTSQDVVSTPAPLLPAPHGEGPFPEGPSSCESPAPQPQPPQEKCKRHLCVGEDATISGCRQINVIKQMCKNSSHNYAIQQLIWSCQCSVVPLNTGLSLARSSGPSSFLLAKMLQKRPRAGPQNLFVSLGNEKRMGTKICSATTVCQVLFPWNPTESSPQFNKGSPVIPIGQISKLSLRGPRTCLLATGLVDRKAWL